MNFTGLKTLMLGTVILCSIPGALGTVVSCTSKEIHQALDTKLHDDKQITDFVSVTETERVIVERTLTWIRIEEPKETPNSAYELKNVLKSEERGIVDFSSSLGLMTSEDSGLVGPIRMLVVSSNTDINDNFLKDKLSEYLQKTSEEGEKEKGLFVFVNSQITLDFPERTFSLMLDQGYNGCSIIWKMGSIIYNRYLNLPESDKIIVSTGSDLPPEEKVIWQESFEKKVEEHKAVWPAN